MSTTHNNEHQDLLPRAFTYFWQFGYYGTSIKDLVKATGYSRSTIYREYKNKNELFKASLLYFNDVIMKEPIGYMEEPDATLDNVQKYFDLILLRMEQQSVPYKGCFIANTMNESSPHDQEFHQIVNTFSERLRCALLNILYNETQNNQNINVKQETLEKMAKYMMTSIYGIWTYSRSISNIEDLKQVIDAYMTTMRYIIVNLDN